jgi:acyl-CoA reductase-like NAD-dependent aldehyde dehydrogenase
MDDKYDGQSTLPTQQSYVAGEYIANTGGETFETRHPGNDRVICEIEQAGPPEVDKAIAAALTAFDSWAQTPAAA